MSNLKTTMIQRINPFAGKLKIYQVQDAKPHADFYQLPTGGFIKLAELEKLESGAKAMSNQSATVVDEATTKAIEKHLPDLKDCKGIAFTKDGKLKNGLVQHHSGKIISLKQLQKLTDAKKIKVNGAETIKP